MLTRRDEARAAGTTTHAVGTSACATKPNTTSPHPAHHRIPIIMTIVPLLKLLNVRRIRKQKINALRNILRYKLIPPFNFSLQSVILDSILLFLLFQFGNLGLQIQTLNINVHDLFFWITFEILVQADVFDTVWQMLS